MENEEYIDKENDHLLNSYNRVINGCKKYHKKSSFIFSSVKYLVEIKEDLVRVRR